LKRKRHWNENFCDCVLQNSHAPLNTKICMELWN
jgi:hypothetical protein